jgi:hypothetical protein
MADALGELDVIDDDELDEPEPELPEEHAERPRAATAASPRAAMTWRF